MARRTNSKADIDLPRTPVAEFDMSSGAAVRGGAGGSDFFFSFDAVGAKPPQQAPLPTSGRPAPTTVNTNAPRGGKRPETAPSRPEPAAEMRRPIETHSPAVPVSAEPVYAGKSAPGLSSFDLTMGAAVETPPKNFMFSFEAINAVQAPAPKEYVEPPKPRPPPKPPVAKPAPQTAAPKSSSGTGLPPSTGLDAFGILPKQPPQPERKSTVPLYTRERVGLLVVLPSADSAGSQSQTASQSKRIPRSNTAPPSSYVASHREAQLHQASRDSNDETIASPDSSPSQYRLSGRWIDVAAVPPSLLGVPAAAPAVQHSLQLAATSPPAPQVQTILLSMSDKQSAPARAVAAAPDYTPVPPASTRAAVPVATSASSAVSRPATSDSVPLVSARYSVGARASSMPVAETAVKEQTAAVVPVAAAVAPVQSVTTARISAPNVVPKVQPTPPARVPLLPTATLPSPTRTVARYPALDSPRDEEESIISQAMNTSRLDADLYADMEPVPSVTSSKHAMPTTSASSLAPNRQSFVNRLRYHEHRDAAPEPPAMQPGYEQDFGQLSSKKAQSLVSMPLSARAAPAQPAAESYEPDYSAYSSRKPQSLVSMPLPSEPDAAFSQKPKPRAASAYGYRSAPPAPRPADVPSARDSSMTSSGSTGSQAGLGRLTFTLRSALRPESASLTRVPSSHLFSASTPPVPQPPPPSVRSQPQPSPRARPLTSRTSEPTMTRYGTPTVSTLLSQQASQSRLIMPGTPDYELGAALMTSSPSPLRFTSDDDEPSFRHMNGFSSFTANETLSVQDSWQRDNTDGYSQLGRTSSSAASYGTVRSSLLSARYDSAPNVLLKQSHPARPAEKEITVTSYATPTTAPSPYDVVRRPMTASAQLSGRSRVRMPIST